MKLLAKLVDRDLERVLGTSTSVNVECLRLSPTRACVRGDYAVTVLLMSLSRGISS